MQKEVKKSWALFTGIGIIMIAHGLQIQVMGIRSVIEEFSVITTGIFMSSYFVGYFVGSKTTPALVSKVGHIRSLCCVCFFGISKRFNCRGLYQSIYVDS